MMYLYFVILSFGITTVSSRSRSKEKNSKENVLQVPPTLSTEFGSGNAAFLGNSTSFFCKASGNPQPKIYWKRYSKYLRRKRYKVVDHDNGVSELIINPVLKADDGYFRCVAENGIGNEVNIWYQLHVLYNVPTIPASIRYVRNGSAHVMGIGFVICYVTGSPRPNVHWERNGKRINTRLKRYKVVFDIDSAKYMYKSQIRIAPVRAADSGRYTCVTNNGIGEGERRTGRLTVYKDVEAPRRVKLKVLNATAILVTWRPPRKHKLNKPLRLKGAVHGFVVTWYWKDIYPRAGIRYLYWSETNQSRFAGNTHSFVITKLEPNKRYNISVGSFNNASYHGRVSKGQVVKTALPLPYKAPIIQIWIRKSTMIYIWFNLPKELWQNRIYKGFHIYYQEINPVNESVGEEFVMDFVPKNPYPDAQPIRNLRPYTAYAIQVAAYNRKGVGPRSERLIANTTGPEPSAPEDLNAVILKEENVRVLISWSSPIITNGEIIKYVFSWKTAKDKYFEYKDLPARKESFLFETVENGREYTFQVYAVNGNGSGPNSSVKMKIPCKET